MRAFRLLVAEWFETLALIGRLVGGLGVVVWYGMVVWLVEAEAID